MLRLEESLVFSPTDLVGHLACENLTQLELRAARGEITRPERVDPELDVLTRRGREHEQRYLDRLRADGARVVEIASDRSEWPNPSLAAKETLRAMREGAEVIYQAVLFDGRWLGYADFLRRVERPSALGPFGYEPVDTKLARRVKASALLQLCSYSELLVAIQGAAPERVHVVLGGMDERSFRLADLAAYYRAVKRLFEQSVGEHLPSTYPDPVEHCAICRWLDVCQGRRRADNHLSLVANMRRDQTRKLVRAGLPTVAALAASPTGGAVRGIGQPTLERLRHQASLQVRQRASGRPLYELLDPEAGRGLCGLPAPSGGDLFFDIEGDPYVEGGGLEYLFGVVEIVDGSPRFHAFRAHDRDEEKEAFERVVDFFSERLTQTPDLHVYHYAAYEPTALKRLMGVHATREREVDRLLRGGVLVDLFNNVVRQGVRVSQESYSLKMLEAFYMGPRTAEVRDAAASIVKYEEWLRTDDLRLLQEIERYNEEDCVSVWKLREWLEARRVELGERLGRELERPAARPAEPGEGQREAEDRTAELVAALTAGIPDDPAGRTPEQRALWLLAQVLGWHRREARSEWWNYFKLCKTSDEDLVEDSEAIGLLEYAGEAGAVKRSIIYRYRFEPQDNKIREGKPAHDPRTEKPAGKVHRLDNEGGILELARGKGASYRDPRELRSVIPEGPLDTKEHREALARIARWVLDNGLGNPGPYRAIRDLLLRRPPRISGLLSGEPLVRSGEDPQEAARRLVRELDETCLPIQGPPGSGKTVTGAAMILELVSAGRRVGVTGPSHKAISNLLKKVYRQADEAGLRVRLLQKADEDERCELEAVRCVETNSEVVAALDAGEVDVVAGTAWLFVRLDMEGRFDTLFVDEAGQVSLANVVAMGGAARNVVLLGDPQQLAQPSKGSHPPGSELSALEHVLWQEGAPGGPGFVRPTMPLETGLFLESTWRLHPGVCAFVSEAFYEGRLHSAPSCSVQSLTSTSSAFAGGPVPKAGAALDATAAVDRGAARGSIEGALPAAWGAAEVGVPEGPLTSVEGAALDATAAVDKSAAHDGTAAVGGAAVNVSRDLTGLRYVPVEHAGNRSSSLEEVEQVAGGVAELLGYGGAAAPAAAEWTDDKGRRRPLGLEDILVVAPYNAQVAALKRRLPAGARVGTVDKFQGQEAPVVVYSMATSSAEDLPRDMEFLYSLNRLNVAVSRARALAVLVCSPRLLEVRCRTPEQMRLANALCRFVEMATG